MSDKTNSNPILNDQEWEQVNVRCGCDILDIVTNVAHGRASPIKTSCLIADRCNVVAEVVAAKQQAEIARLRAELDAANQKLANTTKSAIDIFSSTFCERHQGEVAKESFADFKAKEDASGCPRCLKAIIEKLRHAQTIGNTSTPDFLEWVADRLVHVHGESPSVDFVLSLRERARVGREAVRASLAAKENPNAKA